MYKATKRLIDSVWTLTYEFTADGKVKILGYSRDDQEGYDKEKELLRGSIIESDDQKRTAVKIALAPYDPFKSWVSPKDPDAVFFEVVNPQHVFSYSK